MKENEKQVCKNCDTPFEGKFCNQCGQKRFSDHDRSMVHFFGDALHFMTHLEGSFFTTVKVMFTRPGKWSDEYTSGKQKRYFKPVSFFLLLVVLYLLFPLMSGLNMRFRYYQSLPLVSELNKYLIRLKMETHNLEFSQLEMLFEQQSEKVSKLVLLLLIPLTAMVLALFHPRKKKWISDHLVLSTEINCFFLIVSFLLYPLMIALLGLIFSPEWFQEENPLFISMPLIMTMGAVARSMQRFYQERLWVSLIKSIPFMFLYVFIVFVVYKFILFVTVMLFI